MNGTINHKLLATKALERLERNKARNRIGTNDEKLVPRLMGDGTRNGEGYLTISDLRYAYEERIAIMEYDGGLTVNEAIKLPSLSLFKDF